MYKLELKVNNKVYKEEGKTVLGAFNRLHIPKLCKTRGILTVKKDKLKPYERSFSILKLRLIDAKPFHREVLSKTITNYLK